MTPNIPNVIRLIKTRTSISASEKQLMVFACIALVFLILEFYFVTPFHWSELREKLEHHPNLWVFLAAPLLILIPIFLLAILNIFQVLKLNRVTIDSTQIRWYESNPSWLSRIGLGERRLAWSDVKFVSHSKTFDTVVVRDSPLWPLPIGLRVTDWELENAGPITSKMGSDDQSSKPDLLRVFRENGLLTPETSDPRLANLDYDLTGNPVAKCLLIIMAVIGIAVFVDSLKQDEAWAFFNGRYRLPHLVVCVISVAAMAAWMKFSERGRTLPVRVGFTLALFFGALMGFTSYIEGIRVNQLLGGPLVAQEYHRNSECDKLVPTDPRLPIIEYTAQAKGYWCSIPESQSIKVRVREGLFGLYQVSLREHTQAIGQYRDTH